MFGIKLTLEALKYLAWNWSPTSIRNKFKKGTHKLSVEKVNLIKINTFKKMSHIFCVHMYIYTWLF